MKPGTRNVFFYLIIFIISSGNSVQQSVSGTTQNGVGLQQSRQASHCGNAVRKCCVCAHDCGKGIRLSQDTQHCIFAECWIV